jgi:hypothetical protein
MSESRTDLALDAALRVLGPLVKLLLHEGVTYPRFVGALKQTFLDMAPGLLQSSGTPVNDSSVSTLTGIHRKDVREWRSVGRPLPPARTLGAVMRAFTRWASDPQYCDGQGRPKALDRAGGADSFEALAASVSNDVHPHTLLQELIRLGVAQTQQSGSGAKGEKVILSLDAFVPREGAAEMLQLLSDNVGDHLAAATHNVMGTNAPMLEQSVFADSLRPESVAVMAALARRLWLSAFHDLVRDATALSEQDRGHKDAGQRFRVGMYFYQGDSSKPEPA